VTGRATIARVPGVVLAAVRSEYLRYRRLAELAIEQVGDAELHATLGPDENSIAVLLAHLAGNLRSRFTDFLTSDGEKPWRDRDGEFEPRPAGRGELIERWDEAWAVLLAELDALDELDLAREVRIRGQPLTVAAALARSLAHASYHVGQIVLLARHHAGPRWRSLSIPRGESLRYGANPDRERSPS
jgi:hypothetical protein